MLRLLTGAAVVLGTIMTAAGALAPLLPQADMSNHFRPYTLTGTSGLLVLALATRMPAVARWSAMLTTVNAVLLLLPLLWSAETTRGQALAMAGHRDIKIVTFNMAWRNGHMERVADFLVRENADIVLLQEITEPHAAALRSLLGASYPHSDVCLVPRACRQAIFARRPWVSIEHMHRGEEAPEVISAVFDDRELGRVVVRGVHVAIAYRPKQARHVDKLIAMHGSMNAAVILAGDFNMTPWSYQQQRFLSATGLRRHATFLRSWPTDGQYGLPFPTFLIDHVITTPNIRTISIETGPNLGSDHLPIVTRLRLPPA